MTFPAVRLLTVDNDSRNAGCQAMLRTAAHHGWDVTLVGDGAPKFALREKLVYYPDALRTMAPDDLVLICDARDVLILRGSAEFAAAFAAFGKPLVVSMELFAEGLMSYNAERTDPNGARHKYWQTTDLAPYWAALGVPYPPEGARRFVNSGLMAGRVRDLLAFWTWAAAGGMADDQKAFGAYMCAFPARVAADVKAALLHTCTGGVYGCTESGVQCDDSPTLMELAGRGAFALHVPGQRGVPGGVSGQRLIWDWALKLDPCAAQKQLAEACALRLPWMEYGKARGAIAGPLRPAPRA